MIESKVKYVTRRDQYSYLRDRDLFYNEILVNNINPVRFRPIYDGYILKQDASCQCDETKHANCTCKRGKRYNRALYQNTKSRTYTDVGVGNVKVLSRKRIRKVYLREFVEKSVGNSQHLSMPVATPKTIPEAGFYENKKLSSKCVGGPIGFPTIFNMSQKLSPIVNTRSDGTSPSSPFVLNIHVEKNKVSTSIMAISTQVAECVQIEPDIITKQKLTNTEVQPESIKTITTPESSKEKAKKKESQQRKHNTKIIEIAKPKDDRRFQKVSKSFSSESLIQHVHNLEETPSEDKISRISVGLLNDKLADDKQNKPHQVEDKKDSKDMKNSSMFRRFEALRKKKDERKNPMIVSNTSSPTSPNRKDVSIASDPPSLESRSYSSTKPYSPNSPTPHERLSYKKSQYQTRMDSMSSEPWPQTEDDSDHTGVKGMFKLWGEKFDFNTEQTIKKITTPEPPPKKEVKKPSNVNIGIRIKSVESTAKDQKKKGSKEGRKFFSFGKKSKDKPKPSFIKAKKDMTMGRCEVKDGLLIKVGGNFPPMEPITKAEPKSKPNEAKKAWLEKFTKRMDESKDNVHVRWNNNTFNTSSSTVFELMDTMYNDAGIVLKSKSETSSNRSSSFKRITDQSSLFNQNLQAWMVSHTIPNIIVPLKSNYETITPQNRSVHRNIEVQILKNKWIIEKEKAFSHKIEVVLHSRNLYRYGHDPGCEFLRIDIPKGFFSDDSISNDMDKKFNSSEEVFKIIEYDASYADENKRKSIVDTADTSDPNNLRVTVSLSKPNNQESKLYETVLKLVTSKESISNLDANEPLQEWFEVGLFTPYDNRRNYKKDTYKLHGHMSDDQSFEIRTATTKSQDFTSNYLKEYYEKSMGLDYRVYSESHLECGFDGDSNLYRSKSCPKIDNDSVYMSSKATESKSNKDCIILASKIECGPSTCKDAGAKKEKYKKPKEAKEKKKKDEDGLKDCQRLYPKDSIAVVRKRQMYACSNKGQWCSTGTDQLHILSADSRHEPCTEDCLTASANREKTCRKRVSMCGGGYESCYNDSNRPPDGILNFKRPPGKLSCKRAKICPHPSEVFPEPPCKEMCMQGKKPSDCSKPCAPPCATPIKICGSNTPLPPCADVKTCGSRVPTPPRSCLSTPRGSCQAVPVATDENASPFKTSSTQPSRHTINSNQDPKQTVTTCASAIRFDLSSVQNEEVAQIIRCPSSVNREISGKNHNENCEDKQDHQSTNDNQSQQIYEGRYATNQPSDNPPIECDRLPQTQNDYDQNYAQQDQNDDRNYGNGRQDEGCIPSPTHRCQHNQGCPSRNRSHHDQHCIDNVQEYDTQQRYRTQNIDNNYQDQSNQEYNTQNAVQQRTSYTYVSQQQEDRNMEYMQNYNQEQSYAMKHNAYDNQHQSYDTQRYNTQLQNYDTQNQNYEIRNQNYDTQNQNYEIQNQNYDSQNHQCNHQNRYETYDNQQNQDYNHMRTYHSHAVPDQYENDSYQQQYQQDMRYDQYEQDQYEPQNQNYQYDDQTYQSQEDYYETQNQDYDAGDQNYDSYDQSYNTQDHQLERNMTYEGQQYDTEGQYDSQYRQYANLSPKQSHTDAILAELPYLCPHTPPCYSDPMSNHPCPTNTIVPNYRHADYNCTECRNYSHYSNREKENKLEANDQKLIMTADCRKSDTAVVASLSCCSPMPQMCPSSPPCSRPGKICGVPPSCCDMGPEPSKNPNPCMPPPPPSICEKPVCGGKRPPKCKSTCCNIPTPCPKKCPKEPCMPPPCMPKPFIYPPCGGPKGRSLCPSRACCKRLQQEANCEQYECPPQFICPPSGSNIPCIPPKRQEPKSCSCAVPLLRPDRPPPSDVCPPPGKFPRPPPPPPPCQPPPPCHPSAPSCGPPPPCCRSQCLPPPSCCSSQCPPTPRRPPPCGSPVPRRCPPPMCPPPPPKCPPPPRCPPPQPRCPPPQPRCPPPQPRCSPPPPKCPPPPQKCPPTPPKCPPPTPKCPPPPKRSPPPRRIPSQKCPQSPPKCTPSPAKCPPTPPKCTPSPAKCPPSPPKCPPPAPKCPPSPPACPPPPPKPQCPLPPPPCPPSPMCPKCKKCASPPPRCPPPQTPCPPQSCPPPPCPSQPPPCPPKPCPPPPCKLLCRSSCANPPPSARCIAEKDEMDFICEPPPKAPCRPGNISQSYSFTHYPAHSKSEMYNCEHNQYVENLQSNDQYEERQAANRYEEYPQTINQYEENQQFNYQYGDNAQFNNQSEDNDRYDEQYDENPQYNDHYEENQQFNNEPEDDNDNIYFYNKEPEFTSVNTVCADDGPGGEPCTNPACSEMGQDNLEEGFDDNNQYNDQYDDQYNDQYNDQYHDQYNDQYDKQYEDQYDDNYNNRHEDQYDNVYEDRHDDTRKNKDKPNQPNVVRFDKPNQTDIPMCKEMKYADRTPMKYMPGIHMKKIPQNPPPPPPPAPKRAQNAYNYHEQPNHGGNLVNLDSHEKITIRLKSDTPSTRELRDRDDLEFRVEDEDGHTIFERKEYHSDPNSRARHSPVLEQMYKIGRVSAGPVTSHYDSNIDDKEEEVIVTNAESVGNMVEIQLNIKVNSTDRTAEVNMGDNQILKENTQDVFMVQDGVKKHTDVHNPDRNDVNIRIIIKNYTPKSKHTDAVYLKEKNDYDFEKKISQKFQTVAIGQSKTLSQTNNIDTNAYSIHRATIDLTTSDKSKQKCLSFSERDYCLKEIHSPVGKSSNEVSFNTEEKMEMIGILKSSRVKDLSEHNDTIAENDNSVKYYDKHSDIGTSATDIETDVEFNSIADDVADIIFEKPTTRKQKKDALKKVMELANDPKMRKNNQKRTIKNLLKYILGSTSDPGNIKEMVVTSNDLVKDVTLSSLDPTLYDEKRYIKDETQNIKSTMHFTSREYNTTNETESKMSFKDTYEQPNIPQGTCLCSTFANKLKTTCAIEPGKGCCCCKKVKKNPSVGCDCDLPDEKFETTLVEAEIQKSPSGKNVSDMILYDELMLRPPANVAQVQSKKDPPKNFQSLVQADVDVENETVASDVEDSNKSIEARFIQEISRGKYRKKKNESLEDLPDILQNFETKKAVLEIYTEKSGSKNDSSLYALLPSSTFAEPDEIAVKPSESSGSYSDTYKIELLSKLTMPRDFHKV